MKNAGQTHIIQKETLELSGNNIQLVQKLETDAPRLIQYVLNPVIDQCLAKSEKEEVQTLIDKIEIDLGVFKQTSFEKEVAVRLRQRLTEVLHHGRDVSLQKQSGSVSHSVEVQNEDGSRKDFLRKDAPLIAFLDYLRNGSLPWWWDDQKSPLESWNQLHDEESVDAILTCLRESKPAVSRAIGALDDQILGLLVLRAGYSSAILQGWNEISRMFEIHHTPHRSCRSIYWEYCIGRISSHLPSIEGATASTVNAIRKLVFLSQQELEFFFLTVFASHGEIPENYFSQYRAPNDSASEYIPDDGRRSHEIPEAQASMSPREIAKEGLNSMQAKEHMDSQSRLESIENQRKTRDNMTVKKGVRTREDSFIINAGVILVHPFLEELFRTRALISANQFIGQEASTRAIRLLDYLASGTDASPEYQLLLPKLLCGMPWEDALMTEVMLSDDDKEACNELLSAVISHWKALRGTSIDGLREGFIARQGILEYQQTDFRLRVEGRAQDILLNSLPWGLSAIRLPWMNATLFVSWI